MEHVDENHLQRYVKLWRQGDLDNVSFCENFVLRIMRADRKMWGQILDCLDNESLAALVVYFSETDYDKFAPLVSMYIVHGATGEEKELERVRAHYRLEYEALAALLTETARRRSFE